MGVRVDYACASVYRRPLPTYIPSPDKLKHCQSARDEILGKTIDYIIIPLKTVHNIAIIIIAFPNVYGSSRSIATVATPVLIDMIHDYLHKIIMILLLLGSLKAIVNQLL